ncbi:MAG: hypothetical protein IJL87_01945, partial [Clostridia bacterium]|nr:hypothetical protein [Clostridia bacterium]
MLFGPCSRCKKRKAVVYVSSADPSNHEQKGYCLVCAKELGIKPVDDFLKQFGIDDDQLDAISDQFSDFVDEMGGNLPEGEEGMPFFGDDADGDFEFGGAPLMPSEMFMGETGDEGDGENAGSGFPFDLSSMFGKKKKAEADGEDSGDERKKKKKKR